MIGQKNLSSTCNTPSFTGTECGWVQLLCDSELLPYVDAYMLTLPSTVVLIGDRRQLGYTETGFGMCWMRQPLSDHAIATSLQS